MVVGWLVATASAPNRVPEVLVARLGAEQDLTALTWRQLESQSSQDLPPGSLQLPLDGLDVLRREV